VSDSHELAADAVVVSPIAAQRALLADGPPYRLQFHLIHGQRWPEVALQLLLEGGGLIQIVSTEARLRTFAQWLLDECQA